ncbi:MAG: helix-turn-helix domain-containing protein [Propionibacteriaceae bacterium]|nr:helix-turn-helix domain-containing protein [Propionibacteriaceae bacterium]
MTVSDTDMTTLVKRLLSERGMSDRELGRKAGLSSSMVTQRMKGRARWTFDDLFAVAEAIGVAPTYIVTELEQLARERAATPPSVS